ncbi:MAG: MFS transporter [Bacteroidales bacterium]|nr:MFS transporter [Bacteroidales bacterium]MBQ2090187.1 MFS transporter [Bacteroidales bacterium]MBQ7468288.1 MFS transporter [Bacteroidales bacterium]MBQ8461964.1 MFS transporter [Bacteroidales bacterium]MDT3360533.1 MFS transporter [Bacteroidota bacterium]
MAEKIAKLMNDNPKMRWLALILIALMMFFGYMFVDVMSPLQEMVEAQRGWTPDVFGKYASAEYLLNVCGFLILAGIILDKMGIRFTGTLSASMMFVGAAIKYVAISDWFQDSSICAWLDSWWVEMPGSAKMAAFGFMIFGCGCEMAGTTVSKAIAKWFKGKEMAMAMGIEMAIARVGVFAIFSISPILASKLGGVSGPVGFCTVLLLIGVINFLVFSVMDKKFDSQLAAQGKANGEDASEEEFKLKDLKKVFGSLSFWVVAILCVLYYSAIFPFQRFGANMLQCNLDGISAESAANIFRWFPIGAAVITPFLGRYLDTKGKGATMLIMGALLLIICHLVFAFVLPATHSHLIAYATIVILGVSFSLVPAALWPSVPKIIDEKVLGSAYNLIFWVQNIGLCLVPMLIGSVLASSNADNPAVIAAKQSGADFIPYDYTVPLIIFACFGVAALVIAIYLKVLNGKRNLGLESPNIVKE